MVEFDVFKKQPSSNSEVNGSIELSVDNDSIHIQWIDAKEGYGIAALQSLIAIFEKNKKLYPAANYFSLTDVSQIAEKNSVGVYQLLGFGMGAYDYIRPRYLTHECAKSTWEREGTIEKDRKSVTSYKIN